MMKLLLLACFVSSAVSKTYLVQTGPNHGNDVHRRRMDAEAGADYIDDVMMEAETGADYMNDEKGKNSDSTEQEPQQLKGKGTKHILGSLIPLIPSIVSVISEIMKGLLNPTD